MRAVFGEDGISNALQREQPSKVKANAIARQKQTRQQTQLQNHGISEANHNTHITPSLLVAARWRWRSGLHGSEQKTPETEEFILEPREGRSISRKPSCLIS